LGGSEVHDPVYRKDCIMRTENFNGEEDVIRQLEEQERQAVLQQDLAALERLWAEEFIVNNPQNQLSTSRGDVLALVKRGLIRYAAFERRIESIRFNADIAIVMGAETVEPVGDAPRAGTTVERRFTNIWRKQDATWHMIARHANVTAPAPGQTAIGSNESKASS
jgi:ketosteroid isomerase-like protein